MDNDYSTLLCEAIRTSFSHQALTLISRASLIFGFFWFLLLSTSFWFGWNVEYIGLLAVIFSLLLTHFFLIVAESNFVSKLFFFWRKGKPLVVYRHWLQTEEDAIVFGMNRILLTAIDGVMLSRLGSLVFTSRVLCGPAKYVKNKDINPAVEVLKLRISSIDLSTQKKFINFIKQKCPQANLSHSVVGILDKPILRSNGYIHFLTNLVFLLILLDVGYSTFRYVELLKRYYLADKTALSSDIKRGQSFYDSAEQLRNNIPSCSMVSRQLFTKGQSLAAVLEARSKALWSIGQREQALLAQNDAVALMPKSYKVVLRQVRLCLALGKYDAAKEAIKGLIDKHKHALLPRLYLASLFWQNNKQAEAKSNFKLYKELLDNEYFSQPPVWPASGEESLHELFYQDDLNFLFPDKVLSFHE